MPDAYLASDPQLAACAAWHARISGAPEPQLRRLIALAAAPDPNRAWVGAARSQAGELALLRMLQPYGDAGAMVRAARDAVHEVAPDDPAVSLALLHLALALMQADRYADARAPLEAVLARDADLGLIERVTAVAFLAAVDAHGGASRAAAARVERALELAGPDLLGTFGSGFALTALADALVVFGEAGRASPLGEAGAGLLAMPAPHVTHAHALLILARCHAGRGDHAGARGRLASVRRAVNGADDARAILRLAGELERTLSPAPAGAVSLTRRELDVLRLLDGELTRREIGATLFVSSNTVKTHLRSIMRKLDATSRAEAVERGLSLGLLPGDAGMAADPLAGRPAATSPG
jgi:LuxR family maltose regulon positive regulatory protein